MALTLFQLGSAGKDVRHFITMPWAFPKDYSLGFCLVTVVMFYNLKIELNYNSDLA